MDEHLIISLRVADMRYPLKIKRKDEEIFRKAATEIDQRISQYRRSFTNSSNQPLRPIDYMAMTAIQSVSEKVEQEIRASLFEHKISELISELDTYLKQNR